MLHNNTCSAIKFVGTKQPLYFLIQSLLTMGCSQLSQIQNNFFFNDETCLSLTFLCCHPEDMNLKFIIL